MFKMSKRSMVVKYEIKRLIKQTNPLNRTKTYNITNGIYRNG